MKKFLLSFCVLLSAAIASERRTDLTLLGSVNQLLSGATFTVKSGATFIVESGATFTVPASSLPAAAADGTTKGVATFTASDFNASSGVISIDYTNGQAASGSTKGFLTSTDWTTFNGKESVLTFNSPLSRSTNTISIANAAADGATKGAAAFTAADFDATSGLISIDYTNGQAASGSTKGFLTSTDWTTFNNKVSTGAITGSGLTMATSRILGRTSASAGAVEELTTSEVLDLVGSTRGSLLYRGASGWAILAPGTSGYRLQSNGAGADPTWEAVIGTGTVTHTGGALTSNAVVLGAGTDDAKVVAGISTDGTSALNLGVAGSSVGKVVFSNATSGSITLQPTTGALGTITLTLPAASGTLFTSATTVDALDAANFAADAGANDTYTATLSPAPSAYVTGVHYRFKANTANTGAASINFNSLGAKTIKKAAGGITTDLADNDIRAGQWVDLVYDGTNMQMQSTLGNAAAGGGSGTVSSGTTSQLAYYATSGTTVSGLATANNSILVTNGSGVPSLSTTLPSFTESGTVTWGASGPSMTANSTYGVLIAAAASSSALTQFNTSLSTGFSEARFNNDINNFLEVGHTGSAYSGSFLSGGPSGASAYVTTNGTVPLVLGYNALAKFVINGSGAFFYTLPSISPASGGAYLTINANASTAGGLIFNYNGSLDAYILTSATTNNVIVGSTVGDLCVMMASKNILFSTDSGTTTELKIDTSHNLIAAGSMKTAAPSGGTAAAWKFGTVATVTPTAQNRTIELDVAGTRYFLTAKTTND
jgi:hypothetical protein